jgi:hypothetical protein
LSGAALRGLYHFRFGLHTTSSNLVWLRKALTKTHAGEPEPV